MISGLMCRVTHGSYRWLAAATVLVVVTALVTAGCGPGVHGTVRITSDPDVIEPEDLFEPFEPPPARSEAK